MHSTSRLIAALPRVALLIGCMTFLTAWRWGPPTTYLDEKGAIARAVEKLSAKGGFTRIVSVDIGETEVAIEAQDPTMPQHVNRWTLSMQNFSKLNWEEVSGPEPVSITLANPDLEANLFDVKAVDFSAAQDFAKEAVTRAALEDAASVYRMTIQRQLFLLPKTSSGDVRWTAHVRSVREEARVFGDAKGRFAGLDLTYTNRGRTFNLLTSLDLLPEAARAFAEGVGTEPVLVEVRITSRGMGFESNLQQKPTFGSTKQRQTFNWSFNGLERGSGTLDTSAYFGAEPVFGIGDVDWSLADGLVRKARDVLGMADAALDDLEVTKPGDQAGLPQVEWQITLKQGGEEGVARFDVKGEPLGHTLPESRRKPFDARDPAAWPGLLKQIEASFGGEGAIAELVIHDAHISIAALDPQNPKELGDFLLDENGIKRFGTVSPFAAQNPRFSVADFKALDAAQMRKLQEATAERLKLTPFTISTITIGRASLDPSTAGNVTVEIRAEEGPFKRGGRVNWEIDGREIKAYLP